MSHVADSRQVLADSHQVITALAIGFVARRTSRRQEIKNMCRFTNIRRAAGVALVMLCVSLSGVSGLHAQQPPAPDNSKVNTRDRKPSQVTADQQKNNTSDLQTTKEIRKALVADKSLSTYAHNVKIVTKDGKVTLKGPVRSEDEKKIVEAKAADVAGATNITNQVSVAPKGRTARTPSTK